MFFFLGNEELSPELALVIDRFIDTILTRDGYTTLATPLKQKLKTVSDLRVCRVNHCYYLLIPCLVYFFPLRVSLIMSF